MKTFRIFIIAIFPLLVAAGCDKKPNLTTQEQVTTEVLTFGRAQKNIVIENQRGSIDITGTDASQDISIRIVRRANGTDSTDAGAHIEDVKITKETSGDDVVYKTEYPDDASRKYNVSYFITAPKYFSIRLKQSAGDINVKNMANASLMIENGSGEITINDVWARDLNVENGNGGLAADFWPMDNSTAQFKIGNGNVKLSIPANSNATIDVNNDNGTITNEGLPWLNSNPSKNQFTGILGTGKSIIRCKVGNGNIFLRSSGNQFDIPAGSGK